MQFRMKTALEEVPQVLASSLMSTTCSILIQCVSYQNPLWGSCFAGALRTGRLCLGTSPMAVTHSPCRAGAQLLLRDASGPEGPAGSLQARPLCPHVSHPFGLSTDLSAPLIPGRFSGVPQTHQPFRAHCPATGGGEPGPLTISPFRASQYTFAS